MALKCDNCGKGVMYGNKVSHAKNRTKRLFKPNLHSAKIMVNGSSKHVRLCTKCQRRYKKETIEKTSTTQQPTVVPAAMA